MRVRKKDIFFMLLTAALLVWAAGFALWGVKGIVSEKGKTIPASAKAERKIEKIDSSNAGKESGAGGSNAGKIDRDDWRLILVNFENPLPEEFSVELSSLENGHAVDARCCDDLQEMLADCRREGMEPLICSSYRTQEKQESLFENKVQRLMNDGYSYEEAVETGSGEVAVPGKSEHQTGLAVDIVDAEYQILDTRQEDTNVQKWLLKNSWKYGFILRYPPKKSRITGIIYEPWHYRYVGKKAAEEIYKKDICLEEYLQ